MKKFLVASMFLISFLALPIVQITEVNALIARPEDDSLGNKAELDNDRKERVEKVREKSQERQEKIKELKSAATEKRCSIVDQNIEKLLNRYDTLNPQIVARYKNAVKKLQDLNERLLIQGYDTSDVQFALDNMSNKIIEVNQMNIDLQVKLADAKKLSCGESEGLYKDTVQEAQEMLKDMKVKAQEIKDYYISEVKPAVQELKDQVRDNRNSNSIN